MSLMRWPDMDASKRCTATAKRTGQRRARACPAVTSAGCMVLVPARWLPRPTGEADRKVRELAARVDVDPAQFSGDPYASLRSLLARDQAEFAPSWPPTGPSVTRWAAA